MSPGPSGRISPAKPEGCWKSAGGKSAQPPERGSQNHHAPRWGRGKRNAIKIIPPPPPGRMGNAIPQPGVLTPRLISTSPPGRISIADEENDYFLRRLLWAFCRVRFCFRFFFLPAFRFFFRLFFLALAFFAALPLATCAAFGLAGMASAKDNPTLKVNAASTKVRSNLLIFMVCSLIKPTGLYVRL